MFSGNLFYNEHYYDRVSYDGRSRWEIELEEHKRRQEEELAATREQREQWMADVNMIFSAIEKKYFEGIPDNRSNQDINLLLQAIHSLKSGLIQELRERADKTVIKTAKQLQETLAVVFASDSSPAAKESAQRQFRNTARDSMFSSSTKEKIGVVATVLGVLLVFLGLGFIIFGGVALLAAGIGLVSSGMPLSAGGALGLGLMDNSHDSRGSEVSAHLQALIRSRNYAPLKEQGNSDEKAESGTAPLPNVNPSPTT